jgi:hypothetical protein
LELSGVCSFWNFASSVNGRNGLWILPDDDLKIIECFLILAEAQARDRPRESGIEVVRPGFELLVGNC